MSYCCFGGVTRFPVKRGSVVKKPIPASVVVHQFESTATEPVLEGLLKPSFEDKPSVEDQPLAEDVKVEQSVSCTVSQENLLDIESTSSASDKQKLDGMTPSFVVEDEEQSSVDEHSVIPSDEHAIPKTDSEGKRRKLSRVSFSFDEAEIREVTPRKSYAEKTEEMGSTDSPVVTSQTDESDEPEYFCIGTPPRLSAAGQSDGIDSLWGSRDWCDHKAQSISGEFSACVDGVKKVTMMKTVFVIKVEGETPHVVLRQYSEFKALDLALRHDFPEYSLPELPPKSFFRKNFSCAFKKTREKALGNYIAAAVAADATLSQPALRNFLGLPRNYAQVDEPATAPAVLAASKRPRMLRCFQSKSESRIVQVL
eukprot:TRINITY_DN77347_c0_g1_i1.p1 TRINITY_DN77347_c0_g1~~TRINITY_DN77347_c0_g1_i1.p1  ORF type:complete len:368 (+),score=55.89 TRINITY_DN77347_c0_g1_i1:62-1165(+)